jgi:hypothetical protein
MTINWARENGLLPAGRARDDGRGLLIITAVRAEDSGTYICTATSGQFVATQSAQLTVGGGISVCKYFSSFLKGQCNEIF